MMLGGESHRLEGSCRYQYVAVKERCVSFLVSFLYILSVLIILDI